MQNQRRTNLELPPGVPQRVSIATEVEMLPGPNQYPVYTAISVGQEVRIWGEGGATRLEGLIATLLAGYLGRTGLPTGKAMKCTDEDIVEAMHISQKILALVGKLSKNEQMPEMEDESQDTQGTD